MSVLAQFLAAMRKIARVEFCSICQIDTRHYPTGVRRDAAGNITQERCRCEQCGTETWKEGRDG
jgi:hypothetical protein